MGWEIKVTAFWYSSNNVVDEIAQHLEEVKESRVNIGALSRVETFIGTGYNLLSLQWRPP